MNAAKTAIIRSKNFVVKHKTAVAVAATAAAGLALVYRNQKLFNEFLTEKGLMEEYYSNISE